MKKIILLFPIFLLLAVACSSNLPVNKNNNTPPTQNTTVAVKTYSNMQYGYEFQYPASWTINDHGSTIDNVNKILSFISVNGDGQSFVVRVDQNKPEGFVYQATSQTTVTVNGSKYTAYIFPNGWECYSDTPKDCSTFIIPIQKGNQWFILSAEGKAGSVTETYNSILTGFKFTSPSEAGITKTQPVTWKDAVYNQFKDLATWKKQSLSDWSLIDLDSAKLNAYEKGKVFEISKTFNESGFTGGDVNQAIDKAGAQQTALETYVKKALADNGWKYVAGPTEGGFYHDYLYVKNNHPLVLQIGTRDAVTGGMYTKIEFEY